MGNNTKAIPMVYVGGQPMALPDGQVLDPKYLPKLVFEDNDYTATATTDACGASIILLTAGSMVQNSTCQGDRKYINVKALVYCSNGLWDVGNVVYHQGAFYVALNNGALPDPAMAGADWSNGFSDYAIALKFAINL